jgi:NAD-dependent deacetylase
VLVDTAEVERVAAIISNAPRVTVLTGAGISTDSGIPDFRGPNGVWTVNPAAQQLSTLDRYVADAEIRKQAWRNRRAHGAWTAAPNAGHRAIVNLQRTGQLRALITQNVDGLHQRAGSNPALVIEVHGTIWQAVCLACGDRTTMRSVLTRVEAGEEDPRCLRCGGLLKSATISFGQSLQPQVWRAAVDAARDCDVLLAVGTSLQVQPVASLCDLALSAGARLVVVNAEPTPYDAQADGVLRAPISSVLPALLGEVAA